MAAIAVVAICGTLGLSTSAFAMPSTNAGNGTARPSVTVTSYKLTGSTPITVTQGPVIVLLTDHGENIVELTPSGALVILVRYVQSQPVAHVTVTKIAIAKPPAKAVVSPVLASTVTTTRPNTTTHRGWRGHWFAAGWWSGDPNAGWRSNARFSISWRGGRQPQTKSSFTSWSGDPGNHCQH